MFLSRGNSLILPGELQQKHEYLRPYIEQVGKIVAETVRAYADRQGFAFTGRLKTLESIAEKVESGRYSCWSDVDDFFGCTVIIPTLREEASVISFLETAFEVRQMRRRATTWKAPDAFRFDSTRVIARLRRPAVSQNAPELYQISFEIQVRTAFEHAWSVTTHALAYKSQSVEWNTQRLAAQLRASVEQLDMLVLGFDDAAKQITSSYWPELRDKRELATYFMDQVEQGIIPVEYQPKDWSRFSENLYTLLRAGCKPFEHPKSIQNAIKAIDLELRSGGGASMPRSISLLQWSFAILAAREVISPPLRKYVPPISKDLLLFYPFVQEFSPGFYYELE